MQHRRLEPTGLAKPGKSRGLTGTGPHLARLQEAGRVFGLVQNWTNAFVRSEPGLQADYPDALLILLRTIQLSVYLFNIHQCTFCEFRACFQEVAKLADMVWEVVQEMHFHKVEIGYVNKMLYNLDKICVLSSSMRRRFASTERLFQVTSLFHSSCLRKVTCTFNASVTCFVDLLTRNWVNTSWWQSNTSR